MQRLGIRREDKSRWERRSPLTPSHVKTLCQKHGIDIVVQRSEIRVFPEEDFVAAGAAVRDDLGGCGIVLAIKEIPTELLAAGTVYVYFAHVIKGQPKNMPMLRRLLELGCTLIDYERIVDDGGRRLVFFGRHAGLAGMIDTLWALGRRFRWEGVTTPFEHVRQSVDYADLAAAEKAIREVGEEISARGVPAAVSPVVFGVAGYGHVSKGAQEILDLLPVETLGADTLTSRASGLGSGIDSRRVGKVVFAEEHMAEPAAPGASFQLQEYYQHPERYRARFEEFLPHLTVLVNGIYWDARYPRLVTKDYLRRSYAAGGSPKLRVIGDISCDLGGAIEATTKTTVPDNPVYLYDPSSDRLTDGWEGHGPVILAVDFLPAELPVDASHSFGDVLAPFIPALARADYAVDFEALDLPPELKRAVIVHRGQLTPEYRYIERFLRS